MRTLIWAVDSFALSPDGSRIAYIAYREIPGTYEIWTINLDGTDARHLFDLGRCCSGDLAWSPDGSMLAIGSQDVPMFASGSAPTTSGLSERWAIRTAHADGYGLRRINDYGGWPSWSPDGSRIAFTRGPDLLTMVPNGTNVTMVEGVVVIPLPRHLEPSRWPMTA